MARVFVSYSRKNKDFCRQLTGELQKQEMDFWVDWDDIPPTVDWKEEIEKGIEEADTFIAIVSPDWISSPICLEELNIAVKNGKRLIPVVPCEIVWNEVPPALAHLNFIFFTEAFDFNQQLDKLLTALDTDYGWLKTQRRLQVKALEWERSNKDNGFLLHGKDLEEAEQQISVNATKDPCPTDIQREYVLKSRQAATKQRRITTGILMGLIAGMLGVIALLIQPYIQNAIAQAQAKDQGQMIFVPAGPVTFKVGNTEQTVTLPKFNIEKHVVTNRAYGLCVKVSKCTPPIGSADFNDAQKQDNPVVWLTISQSATYCQWIGRRLPSIAEWEHAARLFAQSPQTKDRFLFSDHYEWTSSYVKDNLQIIGGEWNGPPQNLELAWDFQLRGGVVSSSGGLEIYPSNDGALGTTDNLGFRCAKN